MNSETWRSSKLAKLVKFNEQYSILYSVISGEIKMLEKKLDDYHSYLKKFRKRLNNIEYLDQCEFMNKEIIADFINK